MSEHRRAWRGLTVAGIAAMLSLPACAPKSEPTMQEARAEAKPDAADGMAFDPDALDAAVASLEQSARALPGRTADAHREAVHAYFGAMLEVLPMLEGPEPTGAFRQQVRTLQGARDRLAPGAGGSSVEPAIDTGLRAASAALNRIGQGEEFAGASMQGMLEKLDETVGELDRVRSVGRPYVAADAAMLSAQVVRQMADRLAGRATDTPATVPAEPMPAEPAPAPVEPAPAEPAPEPAPAEAAPEPAPDAAPLPAPEAAPEPAPEAAPEPAPDAAPEPAPAEDPNK